MSVNELEEKLCSRPDIVFRKLMCKGSKGSMCRTSPFEVQTSIPEYILINPTTMTEVFFKVCVCVRVCVCVLSSRCSSGTTQSSFSSVLNNMTYGKHRYYVIKCDIKASFCGYAFPFSDVYLCISVTQNVSLLHQTRRVIKSNKTSTVM